MTPEHPRILILEDTEVLSKMVAATLQDAFPSALIRVAGGLKQARAFVSEHEFDLMILDVNLPDGKGPDFLLEVQQAHPGIKAIFLSGSPLPAHQERARALGAIAFLRKPLRMTWLRKVVTEILTPAPVIPSELSFRGILSNLTPLDLTQLKCLSGATLALEFDQPETGTGRVYFENGKIVHAEVGSLEGEAAFYVIAGWKHGSVTEITEHRDCPATIDLPWATLLMNAAQQRDEATATAPPQREVAATGSRPPGRVPAPSQPVVKAVKAGEIKVLVAEDDAVVAQLIEFKLRQEGFIVIAARDGESALNLAKTERPSLVIMDIMMPVISGFEVLKEMKQSPSLRSIPVILVTSKGRDTDIERGLELGAADYMVKPISPKELMARIKKALRESAAA